MAKLDYTTAAPEIGEPGFGFYIDGKLFGVVAFDFTEDRIRGIYAVVNPDKLPEREV
jgi:hypothetical protein